MENGIEYEVIIVGAGHNGLTCAAYLARKGLRVLVVEGKERIGGACTLMTNEQGVTYSPCAYLCGLLHQTVVDELQLVERGFKWKKAPVLFVSFTDGTHFLFGDDEDKTKEEIIRAGCSEKDVEGYKRLHDMFERVRLKLRPVETDSQNDIWMMGNVTKDLILHRLGDDPEGVKMMFEWSVKEMMDYYFESEKIKLALMGQGIIGTNASPREAGTAYIYFHHYCNILFGEASCWGYVEGGMGVISSLLAQAAKDSGAEIIVNSPVSLIIPGIGVLLQNSKELIKSPIICINADPATALDLLNIPQFDFLSYCSNININDLNLSWTRTKEYEDWVIKVKGIQRIGASLKANLVLRELPNFICSPNENGEVKEFHCGSVNLPLTMDEWDRSFAAIQQGELPDKLWCELYFQTSVDLSVAPPGVHHMSVFAQYVPYKLARGDWDSRRDEIKDLVLNSLASHCSNIPNDVIDIEVLGPPDIEKIVGIKGGHIFHGDCLPQFMWENRLQSSTPIPGVFLCGAGTHPGGSVIAINGRNAAVSILSHLKN